MDLPVDPSLDLALEAGWLTVWFNEPEARNPLTPSARRRCARFARRFGIGVMCAA